VVLAVALGLVSLLPLAGAAPAGPAGSAPPPGPTSLQVSYSVEYGPNETCDPDTVTLGFLAVPEGGTAPYNISWDFGDGSPAGQGEAVQHTYAHWAPPNVTVRVVDAKGQNSSYTSAPAVQPVWLCTTPASPVSILGVPIAYVLVAGLVGIAVIAVGWRVRHSRALRRPRPPGT